MKKALIKVELASILFIFSDFVIQIFKKIQTLKPVAFLKTANQYSVSVSSTKDTNTACKLFTGRLLDKTHHDKTISVQNLFIGSQFQGVLMTETEPKWTWVPNERLGDLYFEQAYADFDAFIEDKWQWEHEDYCDNDCFPDEQAQNTMIETAEPPWTWCPNLRVGDLYFEQAYANFDAFTANKQLDTDHGYPDDDISAYRQTASGDYFVFQGKKHLFVNAIIYSETHYQGQNLIGLTLAAFKSCFAEIDDWTISEQNECRTSEALNAMMWLENGRVASVSLSGDCADD